MTSRYVPHDSFYRRAREQGYRSRAAYKLMDLLRHMSSPQPGDAVVDLGCWPGSWLQVLAARVGPRGRVVGVEIRPTDPLAGPVEILELDFTDPAAPERIRQALGRPADAVFCDAAPKLCGIREVDRAALEELHEAALRVCDGVLKPEGSLVLKGFPGPASERIRTGLRERFARVAEVRPEGKRSTSKEFYWVAGMAQAKPRRRSHRRNRRGKRA